MCCSEAHINLFVYSLISKKFLFFAVYP